MQKILDVMYKIFYIMSDILAIWRCAVRRVNVIALVVTAALSAAPVAAWAQHPGAPPPSGGTTADIQGGDAWRRDPHMRQFYDTVVKAFANGPAKVDAPALETASYAIFRDFAVSKGMNPDAMQDHLKLIPRQMIQIAREDPGVLKDFDAFADALFGPK